MKRIIVVSIVLLALLAFVPAVLAQEETPPVEETGEVVVDEVQPGDVVDETGAVVEEEPGPFNGVGELIAIAALIFTPVAALLSEVWENVLGSPVFGKYARRFALIGGLKALQGVVIQGVLIALAYSFNVNIIEMSDFMGRYLPADSDLGNLLAALAVGALMFAYHQFRNSQAGQVA